jgi:hypothetical protein
MFIIHIYTSSSFTKLTFAQVHHTHIYKVSNDHTTISSLIHKSLCLFLSFTNQEVHEALPPHIMDLFAVRNSGSLLQCLVGSIP